ncbi:MAG: hypothetical protein GC190_11830 [Alphaproteobacteria bacterium]|nr:hypothetical protein [Alphaproteobacteria bacterium]
MADQPQAATAHPVRRFIGLIIISIGVLWLSLTGLCTLFALGSLINEGNLGDIMIVATVAVPSAMIGGVIYFIGHLLRRKQ